MPTYEYKCEACGERFERFQSITADPIKKCPKCGRLKVKRLLGTGAGLIFKGSGFYITDYRSDSYKNSAKAESGGDKAKSGSEGSSSSAGTGGNGSALGSPTASAKPESKPAANNPTSGKSKSDSKK